MSQSRKKVVLDLTALKIDAQAITGLPGTRTLLAQTISPESADCSNWSQCAATSDCNTQENYGTCWHTCNYPPSSYFCDTEWMTGRPACEGQHTRDNFCSTNACC
jgi:hypothetical protein